MSPALLLSDRVNRYMINESVMILLFDNKYFMKNKIYTFLALLCAVIISATCTTHATVTPSTTAPISPNRSSTPTRIITLLPIDTATPAASSTLVTETAQPSSTPVPQRTPGEPVTKLEAGHAVILSQIQMVDLLRGWGMSQNGHILRTSGGGVNWLDVSPPEKGYKLGAVFNQATAWAIPTGGYKITEKPNGASVINGYDYEVAWRTDDGGKTWNSSNLISLALSLS